MKSELQTIAALARKRPEGKTVSATIEKATSAAA
jgi:hypothetical protein